MATTERTNRQTDKLRAAHQVCLETEQIGASIMEDLESQKQTIAHARATLAGASAGLDKSAKILRGMGRRALKNKVLMIVIIITLVIMISFIIWFNWFHHPAEPSPPSPPLPPPLPPPLRL